MLETAGEYWAAQRVKGGRSISNALTIEKEWDMAHPRLIDHAVERGWCRDDEDFSFARCYSDRFYTRMARGRERQAYTQRMLEERRGDIDVAYVMKIMRSHHTDPNFEPPKGSMRDICMHAGGVTRPSQTAGSQVSALYERTPINWFTATSTPCISLYKPVFIEAGLPDIGPEPRGEYDPRTVWWRHELLHRRMLCSYSRYAPTLKSRIRAVEGRLLREAEELRAKFLEGGADVGDLLALTERAFRESQSMEEEFLRIVKPGRCLNPLYAFYWWRVNSAARLPAKEL
ncbi:MAG: hypothetical protein DRK00_05600 [Thermoprotei archaeon]|nr:MAG: hypothetical protein DRK00_05600 [Thermoprotei archaeon]